MLKVKPKANYLKNMQELKTMAVKTWKGNINDETKHLVMSAGYRLMAVVDCKDFASI